MFEVRFDMYDFPSRSCNTYNHILTHAVSPANFACCARSSKRQPRLVVNVGPMSHLHTDTIWWCFVPKDYVHVERG